MIYWFQCMLLYYPLESVSTDSANWMFYVPFVLFIICSMYHFFFLSFVLCIICSMYLCYLLSDLRTICSIYHLLYVSSVLCFICSIYQLFSVSSVLFIICSLYHLFYSSSVESLSSYGMMVKAIVSLLYLLCSEQTQIAPIPSRGSCRNPPKSSMVLNSDRSLRKYS